MAPIWHFAFWQELWMLPRSAVRKREYEDTEAPSGGKKTTACGDGPGVSSQSMGEGGSFGQETKATIRGCLTGA